MNESSPRVESTMNEQPVRSKRSRRLRSALILIVGFGSLSLLIAAGFSVFVCHRGGRIARYDRPADRDQGQESRRSRRIDVSDRESRNQTDRV